MERKIIIEIVRFYYFYISAISKEPFLWLYFSAYLRPTRATFNLITIWSSCGAYILLANSFRDKVLDLYINKKLGRYPKKKCCRVLIKVRHSWKYYNYIGFRNRTHVKNAKAIKLLSFLKIEIQWDGIVLSYILTTFNDST